MFFALGKRKILFSGTFTVSSWQLKTIAFTKTINDIFQFFPCFVQKRAVLRITDVCRRAGCINSQCSFICIFFCSIIVTVFLRIEEQRHLYHHPCDQEDTHLLPSASLPKCVCGKEPVYLHQTELLPESPEAR